MLGRRRRNPDCGQSIIRGWLLDISPTSLLDPRLAGTKQAQESCSKPLETFLREQGRTEVSGSSTTTRNGASAPGHRACSSISLETASGAVFICLDGSPSVEISILSIGFSEPKVAPPARDIGNRPARARETLRCAAAKSVVRHLGSVRAYGTGYAEALAYLLMSIAAPRGVRTAISGRLPRVGQIEKIVESIH